MDTTILQEQLLINIKNARYVRHTHRFRAGDYEKLRAISKESYVPITHIIRYAVKAYIELYEKDLRL